MENPKYFLLHERNETILPVMGQHFGTSEFLRETLVILFISMSQGWNISTTISAEEKYWLWKAGNVVSYLFGTNSFRGFGQWSPSKKMFVLRKCIVFLFLIPAPSYYYLLLDLFSKFMFCWSLASSIFAL